MPLVGNFFVSVMNALHQYVWFLGEDMNNLEILSLLQSEQGGACSATSPGDILVLVNASYHKEYHCIWSRV